MKPILWLLLLAGFTPFRAISQATDPIYGLGVCSSGTYHTHLDVIPKYGTRRAPSTPSAPDSGLHAFLTRFEAGLTGYVNGDPKEWLQNVSRGEDVTILGGWGGYEKGPQRVGVRYQWASARFLPSGARVAVQYLSIVRGDDLAYCVSIERSRVRLAGQVEGVPLALRVTHVFRREAGGWKLLHRHADPLVRKTAPAAVREK